MTTSFSPSQVTGYVGGAVKDMYVLVHKASDTTITSSASMASSTSTAASPSKTNAAASVKGNKSRLGAVTIVGCLGLALIAFF